MIENQLLLSSVFIAGFLSFFAPCTFSLMPAYIGIITDQRGEYKNFKFGKIYINIGAIIKTMTFILGLATSFVILGFGAGFFGKFVNNRWVIFIGGLIVFLLGLHQMEIINIERLNVTKTVNFKNKKTKALGTYLMGLSFSLGWTPCVGPILGAVLLTSASSGKEFYGAFMMLVYSFGLMVPFLLMAVLSSTLNKNFEFFRKYLIFMKRLGGFLIMVMGVVLMTNQLPNLTSFFNNLFI